MIFEIGCGCLDDRFHQLGVSGRSPVLFSQSSWEWLLPPISGLSMVVKNITVSVGERPTRDLPDLHLIGRITR